jgi:hypothetical protein
VYVDDLDIPVGKLTEGAQRVIERAVEESHRRKHPVLTSEHMFYATTSWSWSRSRAATRA